MDHEPWTMNLMKAFAFTLCLALITAGAVVHGAITHRWGSLGTSESKAAALHELVLPLSEYRSEEVPSEIEVKEKSTVTCRRYISTVRGIGGVVSVTTGPPGAVSTHTPDVCYPSSGYKTIAPPKRETLELPTGETVSYYVAVFEKKSATRTDRHRVRWSWATPTSKTWSAPENPRFDFFREVELYKLYVVTPALDFEAGREPSETPAVTEFVTATFTQYVAQLAGR